MRARRIGLMLATALALASCGSGGDEGEAGAAPAAGFPRTITHAMGQTEIPAEPKRVLTMDQAFVDAAFTLDVPIVGYTELPASGSALPEYLGQERQTLAAQARSVGTLAQPNLEAIAALQPDLIISAKVRHEAIYDQLSQIAPTVFSETVGSVFKDNIRLLARATGKEGLAEQRIGAYEQRARQVGDAIRAKVGRNPTISVVRFLGDVRLYYKSSYSGVVLSDAGLARPPSQDVFDPEEIALDISAERIPAADADHIFVSVYDDGTGMPAQIADQFRANPLWGQLRGQIHPVDDTIWGTAVGLQGAQGILDDLAATFQVDPARP